MLYASNDFENVAWSISLRYRVIFNRTAFYEHRIAILHKQFKITYNSRPHVIVVVTTHSCTHPIYFKPVWVSILSYLSKVIDDGYFNGLESTISLFHTHSYIISRFYTLKVHYYFNKKLLCGEYPVPINDAKLCIIQSRLRTATRSRMLK